MISNKNLLRILFPYFLLLPHTLAGQVVQSFPFLFPLMEKGNPKGLRKKDQGQFENTFFLFAIFL